MGQGGADSGVNDRLTTMKLNDEEQDILAGKAGPVPQLALEHQIKVGDFFGADDFVPVTQAHIMADTESLGEAGVRWLEGLAATTEGQRTRARPDHHRSARHRFRQGRRCSGQTPAMLDLERRAIDAFVKLGVSMTDTCINYQTIQAPTRDEHVAFGDTGVVIYSNSVCGARSNFEGGPSALVGRPHRPHAALRLSSRRAAPRRRCTSASIFTPAIAQRLGRARRRDRPARRQLLGGAGDRRHRGRAEIRPAQAFRRGDGELRLDRAVSPRRHHAGGRAALRRRAERTCRAIASTRADVEALQKSYHTDDKVDVVVFSAPQLSLYELRDLAALCDGRRFTVPLLAVTSPQVKPDCDRMGYTARSRRPAARCCRACASTSPMRARSPRPTAGSGSPPTARSSSTSSAATATGRCWPRWRPASTPR